MSAKVLSPYRTLQDDLPNMDRPGIKLVFGSAGPDPGARDFGRSEYSLGTNSDWHPDLHNLTISCVLDNAASLVPLFGAGAVAALDAVLLLALEWTSADSGWRSLGNPQRLTLGQMPSVDETITLLLALPAGSIRGTGFLKIQVFLGEPGRAINGDFGMARHRGARLGELTGVVRVVVDGDGSLFPVLEESLGPDEALWEMRDAWTDPREEPFTSDYVALVLNRDHDLFDHLGTGASGGRVHQTPLMRHVLASWIALFVHAVRAELQKDFDDLVTRPAQTNDFASVADVAMIFVRTGRLDTSDACALFASAQRWLDSRVRETEDRE